MSALKTQQTVLTHRDQEFLRAVAAGRVEVTCGKYPEVFVDGVSWCDPFAARSLIHAGLVEGGRAGRYGERVAAVLTADGTAALRA